VLLSLSISSSTMFLIRLRLTFLSSRKPWLSSLDTLAPVLANGLKRTTVVVARWSAHTTQERQTIRWVPCYRSPGLSQVHLVICPCPKSFTNFSSMRRTPRPAGLPLGPTPFSRPILNGLTSCGPTTRLKSWEDFFAQTCTCPLDAKWTTTP
jgi:hypothetical protein